MPTRVYVLLKLANADSTQIARKIGKTTGVVAVDRLEPPSPDLMVVIEAPSMKTAAGYLMNVLGPLDGMLDDLKVLPVREQVSLSSRRSTAKINMISK